MKRMLAVAVMVLAVAAPVRAADDDKPFARYLAAVTAAQVADNVTTQMVLTPYVDASGATRVRGDLNPLLSNNRGSNALVQAGATILTLVVLRAVEPKHPKVARVLAVGFVALGAYDTGRNLYYFRQR